MKHFSKIFCFELKYYLKNKIFVGVTLFLVLLIALVMFIPRIEAAFDSRETDILEEEAASKELPVMLLQAEEFLLPLAKARFQLAFPQYTVLASDKGQDALEEQITSGGADCAFVLKSATSYTYYVNNYSMYDSKPLVADEVLQKLVQMNAMISGGMTPEQAGEVMAVQVEGEVKTLGADQTENFFYTYIMIFALYMVILLYGQMVATNVATEKSSRAMELLITSAKPTSMMFGKVLASCLAGFLQLVAVFGSALLFFNFNRSYWEDNFIVQSIFDMPPILLVYLLVFFVLGFLVYAFLFGAVGSTASKLEDINTSVMPVTLLFIAGFMVVVFSFSSGEMDSTLMKICSFVPFTSSMAMFTRIAMSTVPWYEIAISIGVLAASVVGIGVISAKIYRVGVLLYGKPPKLTSLLKSVWKA